MILDHTDKVLSKRKADIKSSNMTVHQFLTLSSVVENESLFEKDRAKIAGVFMNRLNKNMPLQSDITVLYALQEKRVAVTSADLQVDSKYNTYKKCGTAGRPCVLAVCGHHGRCSQLRKERLLLLLRQEGRIGHLFKDLRRTSEGCLRK